MGYIKAVVQFDCTTVVQRSFLVQPSAADDVNSYNKNMRTRWVSLVAIIIAPSAISSHRSPIYRYDHHDHEKSKYINYQKQSVMECHPIFPDQKSMERKRSQLGYKGTKP